jgi:FkbM family methyltransferase
MKKITRKFIEIIPSLKRIIKERDDLLIENRKLLLDLKNKEAYKDIFLSPWTDLWKEFYVKNYDSIDLLFKKLKSGLDEESKKVIDNFWEKIIFLIPYNKYKKSYLYKYDDFFSKDEIEEQNKKIDIKKYKLPDGVDVDKTIFSKKNGLIFIDKIITSRIKDSIVIDGGGYFGDSALVFSEYKPKKIYSFEPVDYLYTKLNETRQLNRMEHLIEPVKLGLSNKEKKEKIYIQGSCSSLHITQGREYQVIRTITIDQFLKNKESKVGLIKLDIEGSELEAIEGAIETIKKDRPILLISIYHRPEDFFQIKPLIEELNLGYKFIIRKTSPFRVTAETILIGYFK